MYLTHRISFDMTADLLVAYAVAGWQGSEGDAPGFPKDGTWVVKSEGLMQAL